MKFSRPYHLKEIADFLQIPAVGPDDFKVLGINEIHVVTPGDIVFVDHPKYYEKALNSAATIILINKEVPCPNGKALLISKNPFADFNKLALHFKPFKPTQEAIAKSAKIGIGTIIQPNVFIGNEVVIGKNCLIHPNVCLYDGTIIKDNVIIHSGTIIGADAFYYKKKESGYLKFHSTGQVLIENDVEIGAGCTIDRGVTATTTIKTGSKLDNQIQVGHDTVIGEQCLIASQCGIAGCVIIEDKVTIWGQVGIISGITIGAGATILAQAGVGKSLEAGKTYFGSPAEEARTKMKQLAAIKNLPQLVQKITKN